jgi:tetratricopeptide (TPR) repeat protein
VLFRSLDIAIRAGDAALGRGAPDAAAAHLRRALLEPPPTRELRAEVMTKLAAAAYDVNADEAIRVLDDVIPLLDDPRERGEAQLWLVQALALTDQWDRAARICRDAGAELTEEEDDLRAAFLAVRAVTALFGADDPEPLWTISQHRVLHDDASLGHHLQAGLAALVWAYEGGTAADCTALAHKALARDASIFRRHTLVSVSPLYLLAVGDYPGSLEIWDRIRADAHRSGSPILHLNLDMWLGVTQLRRGDLSAAIEGISTAMGIGHTWGTGKEGMRYHQAHLGEALVEQGDLTRAREVLTQGRPDPASETLGALLWWKAQTALLLAEGKPDEALAAAQTLARRAEWMVSPVGVDHRPRSEEHTSDSSHNPASRMPSSA